MRTYFFRFASEAAAKEALAQFLIDDVWNDACVDAGIPVEASPAVFDEAGEMVSPPVLATGYFVNLLLPVAMPALLQIDGWAGTSVISGGRWQLIEGERPQTPQRVFAI